MQVPCSECSDEVGTICSGGVFYFLFALTWLKMGKSFRRRGNVLGQMDWEEEVFLGTQDCVTLIQAMRALKTHEV